MAAKKSSKPVCFKGEKTKEDSLSTEIRRQCQGKMIPSMLPTFSIDVAAQDDYTSLACHKSPDQPTSLFLKSPFQIRYDILSSKQTPFSRLARHGYDHVGQKTTKRNLENENPIICHSVEEGKENKKTKLFFFVPVHVRNWIKAEKCTKIWGWIKERGIIKREGKLSHPRIKDPGEIQAGQPVTE